MDRDKYFVRPFTDRDYEALSRIDSKVNPEFTFTAEEQQHWEKQFLTPALLDEKWVVEERRSREAVAVGGLSHSPFSYHPHKFWVNLTVDPAHRGRGIGQTLSALIEAEALSHRAVCLWVTVRKDDPRSLEFARRLGFAPLRRLWMSTLDLRASDLPIIPDHSATLEREGLRFTTLAVEGPGRPEVRERLFDLLSEASRDVPRLGDYTPINFEQFVGEFTGPGFLPEGYFLAVDGERYVSMTNFERNLSEPEGLRVGFTGTRKAYRGRGIASELKRQALEYARREGVRYLRTVNDSLNEAMWAINENEGFRRTVEWVAHERQISGEKQPTTAPTHG